MEKKEGEEREREREEKKTADMIISVQIMSVSLN